jgi:hypothetical protein
MAPGREFRSATGSSLRDQEASSEIPATAAASAADRGAGPDPSTDEVMPPSTAAARSTAHIERFDLRRIFIGGNCSYL